jgi:hypothetical protein
MKLLISPTNLEEARICTQAGVDIIDIKNPAEGSLGGHSPNLIKEIVNVVPESFEVSAALGDVNNKPGLVAQAALGVAVCGVDYIKLGLCDQFSFKQALHLVQKVVHTVKNYNAKIKIVICGYADASLYDLFNFEQIPDISHDAGADVAMIDTLVKGNNKGLFDYIDYQSLVNFNNRAHQLQLETALAGSLKEEDIKTIKKENICDFIGIRSLACSDNDRSGSIDPEKISCIKQILK